MNRVREIREQRSLTQVALAEAVSIARQSLSAIESGRADPSVSVALRIARALEVPVDELFGLAQESETLEAELASSEPPVANGRAALVFTKERWVAHPLPLSRSEAADGLLLRSKVRSSVARVEVEPLRPLGALRDNFLIVGCAPALGLLITRLNLSSGPGHFLWLDKPSVEAFDALSRSQAHAAGVHLPPPAVRRSGAARRSAVRWARVTLVHWETGLVVAKGNPLGIVELADLARKGIRICARQPGAGTQRFLEESLEARGLSPARVLAHARVALGHFEAAHSVALGAADVAVAMEGAALALGLDFIPLGTERFDLVLPQETMSDARAVRALDLMNTAGFRQELGALGGYDIRNCGQIVAE